MNDTTVATVDYFRLLGVARAYQIDAPQLKLNYVNLQKQWHPDIFPAGSLKQAAEAKALELNQAYEVLKCDIKRAMHCYALYAGQPFAEATLDGAFLAEFFEASEQLQESIASNNIAALKTLHQETNNTFSELKTQLDSLFAAAPFDAYKACRTITQMQYWHKYITQIEQQLD